MYELARYDEQQGKKQEALRGYAEVAVLPMFDIMLDTMWKQDQSQHDPPKQTAETLWKGLHGGKLDGFDAYLDKVYAEAMPKGKGKKVEPRSKQTDNRVVLCELFTGADCGPCVAADVAFSELVKNYAAQRSGLAGISRAHSPPGCLANSDTEQRFQFYFPERGGTPTFVISGKPVQVGGYLHQAEEVYSTLHGQVDLMLLRKTTVRIDLKAQPKDGAVAVTAEANGSFAATDPVRLRLVLAESASVCGDPTASASTTWWFARCREAPRASSSRTASSATRERSTSPRSSASSTITCGLTKRRTEPRSPSSPSICRTCASWPSCRMTRRKRSTRPPRSHSRPGRLPQRVKQGLGRKDERRGSRRQQGLAVRRPGARRRLRAVRIPPVGLATVFFAATALASAARAAETPSPAKDAPPKSLDPRLKIELFAEQPQIVTPTDLAVDYQGRVWAIECNTHFRPAGYKGHPTDRILVFTPKPEGGRAGTPQVFADGFTHAMSIAVPYKDGVYVATRREVFHLVDKDGDGKADKRRSILKLETKGDYPHNGLAGFAFDGLGNMYFGLGENLGADYRLVGTDGSRFRRRRRRQPVPLQAGRHRPHAVGDRLLESDSSCVRCVRQHVHGRQRPGRRPPCRLLHIIPGGDYGYRFRNGRRGIHPFTAWNGELPGTLPMMAGTGEAPSGIIAYESDGFPEEYRGNLLVSSWGDHRIDRFRPKAKGTSFSAKLEPLIVGGENFRPVGVALRPMAPFISRTGCSKTTTCTARGGFGGSPPRSRARSRSRIWRRSKRCPSELCVTSSARLEWISAGTRLDCSFKVDQMRLKVCRFLRTADRARRRGRPTGGANSVAKCVAPPRSSLKNPEILWLWPFEPFNDSVGDDSLLQRLKHPWDVNPSCVLASVNRRDPLLPNARLRHFWGGSSPAAIGLSLPQSSRPSRMLPAWGRQSWRNGFNLSGRRSSRFDSRCS